MEELNKTKGFQNLIKSRRNKVIIFIIVCMIINLILVPFAPSGNGGARHLDGATATPHEVVNATITTIFIGFPFFGFILGAIASLFPYKQLPYSKKYLNFSLVIILALEMLMLILSLIVLLKHSAIVRVPARTAISMMI